MKLNINVEMPERAAPEKEEHEECPQCQQQHDQYSRCEGFGFDHFQEPAYETAQVENSSYLQRALAQFKRKRAKKNAKD